MPVGMGHPPPGSSMYLQSMTILWCFVPVERINVCGGRGVGVGVSVYCYSRGQLGEPMLPVSTTLDSVGLDVLVPRRDMCPPDTQEEWH